MKKVFVCLGDNAMARGNDYIGADPHLLVGVVATVGAS